MREWVILDAMSVVFEVADDVNELLVPLVQQRMPNLDATITRAGLLFR